MNMEDQGMYTRKESWTREELIPILAEIMNLGMTIRQGQLTNGSKGTPRDQLDKWIKDNL